MDNKDISHLYGVVHELIVRTRQNIKDFEYVIKNKSLKKDLQNIEIVYMNSIILDISKLINATRSDKTGLEQLKNIVPQEFKDKIDTLRKSYGGIFKKISNNRNRIIAHIDISDKKAYYTMGLSRIEIKRIINDYRNSPYYDKQHSDKDDQFIKNMQNVKAKSKNNERYSLSDFSSDLKKIKGFLNEISLINNSLLGVLKQTK